LAIRQTVGRASRESLGPGRVLMEADTEHDWLEIPEAVFEELHAADTAQAIERMKAQRAYARPLPEQTLHS